MNPHAFCVPLLVAGTPRRRFPGIDFRVAAAHARAYNDEIKAKRDLASERSELAGPAQVLPHVAS